MQKSALQVEADRATADDVRIMVNMAEQASDLLFDLHQLIRGSPELQIASKPLAQAYAKVFYLTCALDVAAYRIER